MTELITGRAPVLAAGPTNAASPGTGSKLTNGVQRAGIASGMGLLGAGLGTIIGMRTGNPVRAAAVGAVLAGGAGLLASGSMLKARESSRAPATTATLEALDGTELLKGPKIGRGWYGQVGTGTYTDHYTYQGQCRDETVIKDRHGRRVGSVETREPCTKHGSREVTRDVYKLKQADIGLARFPNDIATTSISSLVRSPRFDSELHAAKHPIVVLRDPAAGTFSMGLAYPEGADLDSPFDISVDDLTLGATLPDGTEVIGAVQNVKPRIPGRPMSSERELQMAFSPEVTPEIQAQLEQAVTASFNTRAEEKRSARGIELGATVGPVQFDVRATETFSTVDDALASSTMVDALRSSEAAVLVKFVNRDTDLGIKQSGFAVGTLTPEASSDWSAATARLTHEHDALIIYRGEDGQLASRPGPRMDIDARESARVLVERLNAELAAS